MRLVAFCEAVADFRSASGLVDRVLREDGPAWIGDVLDASPDEVRSWQGDGQGRSFFLVRQLASYASELGLRVPQGHFAGQPGAADALMGRTAFTIVRALVRRGAVIDAALMIRDIDDQPARATGLEQARTEARSWASFSIVLGCALPKREAWVLCGFEPETEAEQASLRALRQELGFAPHVHAHLLAAKDEQAKRSAKRVLGVLCGEDWDREARCWAETSLDTLRARGHTTGLTEYLAELKQQLVPLADRR